MSEILVVGGGLAAAAFVAAARRRGIDSEITVLCAEERLPYDRPPLSKELFSLRAPADLAVEFEVLDAATWVTGEAALTLGPAAGHVVGASGTRYTARQVVLATGVEPFRPWHASGYLSTFEDMEALRAGLEEGGSLAVVGAGWIGLEVASAARTAGLRVTLLDETPEPLGTHLPGAVGQRIRRWLEDAGVELRLGQRVRGADATSVALANGSTLAADRVLTALGTRPATAWLPREILAASGHVPVDATGRVLSPGAASLWAIGDCTSREGSVDQHWNAAIDAAERCAAAIAGEPVPAPAVPHVFSTICGHDVQFLGHAPPAAVVTFGVTDTGWTAHLTENEILAGAVVVDTPRQVLKTKRLLARAGTGVPDGPAQT